MDKARNVAIGRIIGLHGVRGEVKLLPYGDVDEAVLKRVFLDGGLGAGGGSLSVTGIRRNKAHLIVAFEGRSTREASAPLVGSELFIPADALPELPPGQFYHHDLEGMEVFEDTGGPLGQVVNVIATGSNDVLEVKGPRGAVLIPVIEGSVVKVDPALRRITVRLMEGLLDAGEKTVE